MNKVLAYYQMQHPLYAACGTMGSDASPMGETFQQWIANMIAFGNALADWQGRNATWLAQATEDPVEYAKYSNFSAAVLASEAQRSQAVQLLTKSANEKAAAMKKDCGFLGMGCVFETVVSAVGFVADTVGKVAAVVGKIVVAPLRVVGEVTKYAAEAVSFVIKNTPLKFVDQITGGIVTGALKAAEVGGKAVAASQEIVDAALNAGISGKDMMAAADEARRNLKGNAISADELKEAAVGVLGAGLAVVSGGTLSGVLSIAIKNAAVNATVAVLQETPLGKTALVGALAGISGALAGGASKGLDLLLEAGKKVAVEEAAKANKILGVAAGGLVDGKSLADIAKDSAIAASAENPVLQMAVRGILSGEIPATPELKAEALIHASVETSKKYALEELARTTKLDVGVLGALASGVDPSKFNVDLKIAELAKKTVEGAENVAMVELEKRAKISTGVAEKIVNLEKNIAIEKTKASDITSEVSAKELADKGFANADKQANLTNNAELFKVEIADLPNTTLSKAQRQKNAEKVVALYKNKVAEAQIVQAAKAAQAIAKAKQLQDLAKQIDELDKIAQAAIGATKEQLLAKIEALLLALEGQKIELEQAKLDSEAAAKHVEDVKAEGSLKVAAAGQGRYWIGYEYAHPYVLWRML